MALPVRRDPKLEILREEGVLNPHPERVQDVLFIEHDFFDARDLVQVKYEMVRRVEVDGLSVSDAAGAFGLSRPAFYQARESLHALGVAGLLPRKRGPHGGHKLSLTVVAFLERTRAEEPSLRASDLVQRVEQHFGVGVHPRSIERALARQAKKDHERRDLGSGARIRRDDATALAHYEHLRRHVLGQEHDHEGAPGLALVMRGGMHACLAMVEPTGTVRTAVAPHAEAATEIDGGLRDDVARVVVAMAIGAAFEQEARSWRTTCRARSKRDI